MSSWISHLNSPQQEAALHNYGPLLILAGAGSGKTTVLVARAGRLLDDQIISADQLCVLTFTNKAARELKERVAYKLGQKLAKKIWAGTFHSFGLTVLKQYADAAQLPKKFGILNASDSVQIMKDISKNLTIFGKTDFDGNRIASIISMLRENPRYTINPDNEYELMALEILPKYLKQLELLGVTDFDGLILKPLELFKNHPAILKEVQMHFYQVMVDEFQDTNPMQMELIKNLVEEHKNITVVGDDDQSIYGWRGACIRNILDFPKRYSNCKVVRLEENYRSTPQILELANAVIQKNTERHSKVLRTSKGESPSKPDIFSFQDEIEESETIVGEIAKLYQKGIPYHDMAILYRANSQADLIEIELRKQNIPYQVTGGTAFFDRKEIRDILAYLRCSIAPQEVAFRRILNTPPRGIGEKTIERLTEYARESGLTFFKAAKNWREAGTLLDDKIDDKTGAKIDSVLEFLSSIQPRVFRLETTTPGGNLLLLLTELGYREYLEKKSRDALAATKSWNLIETFARVFDRCIDREGRTPQAFEKFVDSMELRDFEDEKDKKEKVQLMTLHACKGLEFPYVFLIGVEEDILPHKTLGSDISEERRLFYVGITRAQTHLTLSRTKNRKRHGKSAPVVTSRFLLEIPKHLYNELEGPRPVDTNFRKNLLDELYKKLDSLENPTATSR